MARTVKLRFPGNKKVDVVIGDTVIPTDQSLKNGGDASAPEPFHLFLASIAACAGIYALEFCRSRSLSTDGMDMRMKCERGPERKRYTKMTIDLKLPQNFPEKFIPAITRSIDLCAVKKHIVNAPEFVIDAHS